MTKEKKYVYIVEEFVPEEAIWQCESAWISEDKAENRIKKLMAEEGFNRSDYDINKLAVQE